MKIETRTKKKFKVELYIFEQLLVTGQGLCDNFKFSIIRYHTDNGYGTLHFFLARNLRLIRTSYDLAIGGKYTEAFIIIRSAMEGSLLSRYLSSHPRLMEDWHQKQLEINAEQDLKIKKNLIRKLSQLYGPGAIRNKIAGPNRIKLSEDFWRIYNVLSDYVHPPITSEGEFLLGKPNNYIIDSKPLFHESLFIEWFRAAALCLATSLKMLDILYRKKEFGHLGRPFAFKIKEMAEQIIDLIEIRGKINKK